LVADSPACRRHCTSRSAASTPCYGRLAITTDHYPHLYELAPGAWACLGYNGRGVAMATVMGAQLARCMIDGRDVANLPMTPLMFDPSERWSQRRT